MHFLGWVLISKEIQSRYCLFFIFSKKGLLEIITTAAEAIFKLLLTCVLYHVEQCNANSWKKRASYDESYGQVNEIPRGKPSVVTLKVDIKFQV